MCHGLARPFVRDHFKLKTREKSLVRKLIGFKPNLYLNIQKEMQNLREASKCAPIMITAGSYEGSIFGWDVDSHGTTMSFGFHCSAGSMKTITVSKSGKYLVCGGMDERIRIFDMRLKKAVGELTTHTGTITSLKFFEDSYLISGSEDNTLCIWRVYDWTCVHILGGHKSTINDLAIHPSGKIVLSVARDNTMKLWNLIEGRIAFTRRLKGSADKVAWDESGSHYLLVVNKEVQSYSSADNSCTAIVVNDCRVNQALFMPSTKGSKHSRSKNRNIKHSADNEGTHIDAFLVLTENRLLTVYTLNGARVSQIELPIEGGRTRDMACVVASSVDNEPVVDECDTDVQSGFISIVTSAGMLFMLRLDALMDQNSSFESCYFSSFSVKVEPRLTCIAAWTSLPKPIIDAGITEFEAKGESKLSESKKNVIKKQKSKSAEPGKNGSKSHPSSTVLNEDDGSANKESTRNAKRKIMATKKDFVNQVGKKKVNFLAK